ncbi:MAG: aminopeptidase [Proteobacteria bacterium]|nr:aminopeptidase [Pseudomonadota bacterium]
MLTEKELDTYAEVLLWGMKTARTGSYKKHDIIVVRYDLAALRLAEILQVKLLEMGMNPVLRLSATSNMELSFYEKASPAQLVFLAPGEKELCEHLNGSIYLHAPESLTHLRTIDSRKIGKAAVARKLLRDIFNKREEAGQFGWTLCSLPTPAQARHARLSFREYARQIAKACYLNKTNPVGEWETILKNAGAIKKWLNSMPVRAYHIESEHIDLMITPGEKRRWIGVSGHNIPSFEIFLSPDWRGTEGTYYANQPSYRSGNYVQGVRFIFKKGAAVKISAEKGEDFVKKQLSMDKGANKVGEFSLTDIRFSKIDTFMANTLYDENYGGRYGNCHLAVGSSYSDTYSGNPALLTRKVKEQLGFNDSALHWDLINTERKTVTAHLKTGKKTVIYDNGKFNC